MNAPAVGTHPRMRSYLARASQFAAGAESPRDFLEACLANLNSWEPKVGAFVNLNIDGARAAADRATERWRAGAPLSPIDGMPIGVNRHDREESRRRQLLALHGLW